jgi:hypothetical protein
MHLVIALLVSAGVLASLVGAFLPPLQALLPRLGLVTYHRQRAVRRAFGLAGLALSITSLLIAHTGGTGAAAAVSLFLLLMSEIFLVPRTLIPPLDNPPAGTSLPAGGPVLALVVEGRAHAYPLDLLIPHHIVNETVGGVPVVATYCPACRSGSIFDPVVRGRRLTFEPVSVRRRNMVMRDRETGTVWQQETGEALRGQLAGETLRLLGGEICTWETWRTEHPGSTACARPPGYRHPHPLGVLFGRLLDRGPEHLVGPGLHGIDRRLDQHAFVAGVVVDGVPKAYPLDVLRDLGTVEDRVGKTAVRLSYDARADRVRATAGQAALLVSREWWLAWSEYHPGSLLYEKTRPGNSGRGT